MKKLTFLILTLAFILLCDSCASNDISSTQGSTKNNKQQEQKLRFDDWKYMGFGTEIPEWFDYAASGKLDKVEKSLPDLKERQLMIITTRGGNRDQAEDSAKITIQEIEPEYQYYDGFWARLADEKEAGYEPYISVYIYYK